MQPKTIESKHNNFVKMEDDLHFFEKGRRPQFKTNKHNAT
jgi:hypothetical protein